MSQGHSVRVVVVTLSGNAVIFVAKLVAALFTRSGSMLAEAIHSLADCLNQVFLLVGLEQAAAKPNEWHPLGMGRASYFWSFLVALMLFFGGGVFSLVEGFEKALHPTTIERVGIGLGVLLFSLVVESVSLSQAVRELRKKARGMPLWQYVRVTKDAELVVCAGEDLAAVLGLAIAALSLALAAWVHPAFDGVGSIGIGVVLVLVAFFLAGKVKSLLLGERADPEIEAAVLTAAKEDARIVEVLRMITIQQGPGEVMLAAKVRLAEAISSSDVVLVINEFEARVRARIPEMRWQFIEPDKEA